MSLITTSPVLDVSNHVYVQSPGAFSARDRNVPDQCRHIGFTLAFFFFFLIPASSPPLLVECFPCRKKGTTSAAFTAEVFFVLFFFLRAHHVSGRYSSDAVWYTHIHSAWYFIGSQCVGAPSYHVL